MSLSYDIADVVRHLDSIGFNVGDTRVSVYRAIVFLAVAFAVVIAGRLSGLFIRRFFRRLHRLDPAQQLLGEKLTSIAVWVGLILIGIDVLGISLTALTVFSGAFGLAIGFGLQKTFGNLISGIILLMDRSIKPGDVIAVGEGANRTVGQVNRIGIRAVSVITRDRVEYLIPNEHLMTSQVENWSYSSRDVRVKITINVAYGSDIDLVERLLLDQARKTPRILDRIPPQAWLSNFAANSIEFEVQIWIEDPEEGLGNLRSDFLKGVWHCFKANGITIPFAQHDIHVKDWPEMRRLPDSES